MKNSFFILILVILFINSVVVINTDMALALDDRDVLGKNEEFTSSSIFKKILSKAAGKLISKLLNIPLGNHPPTIYNFGTWFVVEHESVNFNKNGIGPIVVKNMIGRGGDRISVYARRNHLSLTNRLTIDVYIDGNRVAAESVRSGQAVEFIIPGFPDMEKNITIEYRESYKRSWIPVVLYEFIYNIIPPGVEPFFLETEKNNLDIY